MRRISFWRACFQALQCSGEPARADVGCGCVRLGSPAVCTATVTECNVKVGGLCLAPCDYQPPKKARHSKKHKNKEA